jgi:hypothetical protein
MQEMSRARLSRLQSLSLTLCDDSLLSVEMPQLELLSLSGRGVRLSSLGPLVKRSPRLRKLTLASLPELDDDILLAAMEASSSICNLDISRCPLITVLIVYGLSPAPQLRAVSVQDCAAFVFQQADGVALWPLLRMSPELDRLELGLPASVRAEARKRYPKRFASLL